MLVEAEKKFPDSDKLPLIRLKIEYTGFKIPRILRIKEHFEGEIANEQDFLQFWQKKSFEKRGRGQADITYEPAEDLLNMMDDMPKEQKD